MARAGIILNLVKQCQNKEVYLDCKTEEYLADLMNTCMCLPFGLKYFNDSNFSICNSTQMACARETKNLESKCLNRCEGLVVTSYSHQNNPNVLDEKAIDCLNEYFNNHPKRLQQQLSTYIATTVGTNTTLQQLVNDSAVNAVDFYFQEDDNPYLKNFDKRITMGVVQNHLAASPSRQTGLPWVYWCRHS